MPRKKKIETAEPIIEARIETIIETAESEAKKSFRAFIEKYKADNPAKYVLKEKELLNKLNQL